MQGKAEKLRVTKAILKKTQVGGIKLCDLTVNISGTSNKTICYWRKDKRKKHNETESKIQK